MRGLCFPSQHCCLPAASSPARARSLLVIFLVTLLHNVHLGLVVLHAKVVIREEIVLLLCNREFNWLLASFLKSSPHMEDGMLLALNLGVRWFLALTLRPITNSYMLILFTHHSTDLHWCQQSSKFEKNNTEKELLCFIHSAKMMILKIYISMNLY